MKNLSQISLRHLFRRKFRTFLTAFGITLGVATILATAISTENAATSLNMVLADTSGKADLTITQSSFFPDSTLQKVKKVEGVKKAVPSANFPSILTRDNKKENIQALLVDPETDPEIRKYHLAEGKLLTSRSRRTVLLTKDYAQKRGLKVGDKISLLLPAGKRVLRISGLIRTTGIGASNAGAIAILSLEDSENLLGYKHKINSIDVQKEEKTNINRLRRNLAKALGPSFEVEKTAAASSYFVQTIKGFNTGLNFLSAIALLVGAFLIYNTFQRSIMERKREFSILRAIGATRNQIVTLVISEALVVGILASLLGVVVGFLLSNLLTKIQASLLSTQIELISISLSWVIASFAVGVLTTLLAALIPAINARGFSLIEAMGQLPIMPKRPRLQVVRLMLGTLLLASGLLGAYRCHSQLSTVSTSEVGITSCLLLLSVFFLLPFLVKPLSLICSAPFKLISRHEVHIAQRNLNASRERTALVIMGMIIGIVMVIGVGAISISSTSGIRQFFGSISEDTIEIRTQQITTASTPLNQNLEAEIAKVPGVSQVNRLKVSTGKTKYGDVMLEIDDPELVGFHIIEKGEQKKAQEQFKKGKGVFISNQLSERANLKVGKKIELNTPKGKKKLLVLATTVTPLGKTVTMPWPLASKYYDTSTVDVFEATPKPNYKLDEVMDNLEKEIGRRHGLIIESAKDFQQEIEKFLVALTIILNAISSMGVVVAALGIANILLISILERVREIGILRAIGSTKNQIKQITLVEAGIVGLSGGLVGIALGLLLSRLMVEAMTRISDTSFQYIFPWWPIGWSLFIALVVPVAVSILPARHAAQTKITKAIQYE